MILGRKSRILILAAKSLLRFSLFVLVIIVLVSLARYFLDPIHKAIVPGLALLGMLWIFVLDARRRVLDDEIESAEDNLNRENAECKKDCHAVGGSAECECLESAPPAENIP